MNLSGVACTQYYIEQMAEEMSRNSTEDYNSKICDPVEFDRVT